MTTYTNNPAGKYASVNGNNLYYQIHGTGKPLIMLHGGFGTFDMFTALSPALALDHQVIGVDLYGHGHTAITDRPIRFERMADDIAGLIHHLGLEKADLLGYSLGGAVALQTAIRHPERVNKLVVISTPFKRTGWHPEIQTGMTSIAPEFFLGTPKTKPPHRTGNQTMTIFEQILALLENNKVQYRLIEHQPIRTSEEAARIRDVALKTGAKAMIVRGKDHYYLLVLPADKHIDWCSVQ